MTVLLCSADSKTDGSQGRMVDRAGLGHLQEQRLIRLLKTGTPEYDDTIGPLAWTNATPSQPEVLDSQLLARAPVAP